MVREQELVKAEADAIMHAPLKLDPYSPEGSAELARRNELYRLYWTEWTKERDLELAAERKALAAAMSKAQKEAEREEAIAAAAEGRTVRTVKGTYRAPKGEEKPTKVTALQVTPASKGPRTCKACKKVIPPTGQRGRPAAYHAECRP